VLALSGGLEARAWHIDSCPVSATQHIPQTLVLGQDVVEEVLAGPDFAFQVVSIPTALLQAGEGGGR